MKSKVLVTGACGGIGKAVCSVLLKQGYEVIRLDITGQEDDVTQFDATNEAAWNALRHEGVAALVHAAGIRKRSPLQQTSLDDFKHVVETNLYSAFLALQWAARHESEAPLSVVLLSSAVTNKLPENQHAYNASKAALNTLVLSTAKELATKNIRVNAVAPGSILTPMTAAGWSDETHAARMRREIPMSRPGEAAEVAATVEFLISERSSYITGAIIPVDGGWSI